MFDVDDQLRKGPAPSPIVGGNHVVFVMRAQTESEDVMGRARYNMERLNIEQCINESRTVRSWV